MPPGQGLRHVYWEKIPWEKTPYDGVFVYSIKEEPDPGNPSIPKFTVMAVKVEPGKSIPLHRHNREPGWRETLTFPQGGEFEIKREGDLETISGNKPVTLTIRPREIFGLKNNSPEALCFQSNMKPGFTGYQEIEEIK